LLNGDYYYLIVAYNESGFTSSNCVYVLVMIPPGLFILSSDFNISDIDGILNLKWSHSSGGDNYSIYVHNTTISELTGIEILLAEGIKSHQYQIYSVLKQLGIEHIQDYVEEAGDYILKTHFKEFSTSDLRKVLEIFDKN